MHTSNADQFMCPGVTTPSSSQLPPPLSGHDGWIIISTIAVVGALVLLVVLAPIMACAVYARRKAMESGPTFYGDGNLSSARVHGTFQMNENGSYINQDAFSGQLYNRMEEDQANRSQSDPHQSNNTPSGNSRGNTLEYDYVIP